MTDRIFYSQCPSCYSYHIKKNLTATDHTVTQESFEIWHCNDCSLRFTQNIPDQSTIARYYKSEDYISHSNTNKGLVNRLYRFVRFFTLRSKRNLIRSRTKLSKGILLEVGAGTGAFAASMKNYGWTVFALEPDDTVRKRAAELYSIQINEPSELFEMKENYFDVITLWHVLEHVHSLHQYIIQLKKILKPGGVLLIAVPNYTCYDAERYQQFWAAYDVPRHLYHFSPVSMRKLLHLHGFTLKNILPMWFDSFYISMLSEKYKTGKVNLVKGFWRGALSNARTLFKKEKASSLIYVITK